MKDTGPTLAPRTQEAAGSGVWSRTQLHQSIYVKRFRLYHTIHVGKQYKIHNCADISANLHY